MSRSPMTFTEEAPSLTSLTNTLGKILCRTFDVDKLVLFALFNVRQEGLENTESHLEATSV